jgi:membrane-associated protease RseP (regulator of RpoE activity)
MPNARESARFSLPSLRIITAVSAFTVLSAVLCFSQNSGTDTLTEEAAQGVAVGHVTPGGPAAQAGISADDIIMSIEGTPVQSIRQIIEALLGHEPGDTMEMTIARASDGTSAEITMTLGSDPHGGPRPYMGLSIDVALLLVPEGELPDAGRQAPPGI